MATTKMTFHSTASEIRIEVVFIYFILLYSHILYILFSTKKNLPSIVCQWWKIRCERTNASISLDLTCFPIHKLLSICPRVSTYYRIFYHAINRAFFGQNQSIFNNGWYTIVHWPTATTQFTGAHKNLMDFWFYFWFCCESMAILFGRWVTPDGRTEQHITCEDQKLKKTDTINVLKLFLACNRIMENQFSDTSVIRSTYGRIASFAYGYSNFRSSVSKKWFALLPFCVKLYCWYLFLRRSFRVKCSEAIMLWCEKSQCGMKRKGVRIKRM